jgi:hypothetical protein
MEELWQKRQLLIKGLRGASEFSGYKFLCVWKNRNQIEKIETKRIDNFVIWLGLMVNSNTAMLS